MKPIPTPLISAIRLFRPRTLAGLSLCLTLAACGSSVKLDESNPATVEQRTGATQAGQGAQSSGTGQAGADSRAITEVQAGDSQQTDQLNDPSGLLSERTIFFDYDSFTIRDEFRAMVEAHAQYLTANPDRRIVLQGNTDERGAREYNLALGQKRSEAVRRALAALGVTDQQVEAISFGEERPRNYGQSEEAFAENRRVDIVYQ